MGTYHGLGLRSACLVPESSRAVWALSLRSLALFI